MGGEYCVGNNNPITLSPEDELAIKNKNIFWGCKVKFLSLVEKCQSAIHDHLSNPVLSGGNIFRGLAHKSCNLKVKQQYFIPVYMHKFQL